MYLSTSTTWNNDPKTKKIKWKMEKHSAHKQHKDKLKDKPLLKIKNSYFKGRTTQTML